MSPVRWRFRLRSLLLFVALIAVCLAAYRFGVSHTTNKYEVVIQSLENERDSDRQKIESLVSRVGEASDASRSLKKRLVEAQARAKAFEEVWQNQVTRLSWSKPDPNGRIQLRPSYWETLLRASLASTDQSIRNWAIEQIGTLVVSETDDDVEAILAPLAQDSNRWVRDTVLGILSASRTHTWHHRNGSKNVEPPNCPYVNRNTRTSDSIEKALFLESFKRESPFDD